MQHIDSPDILGTFLNVRAKLIAAIYRRVRCHATTFDLVQDTFLRLWERKGLLGSTVDLSGYVLVTGRNLAIDHERRKRIAPIVAGIDHLDYVADPSPSQEASVMGRQELQRLQFIVDALPPRCREVFLLSRIEGLTFAEIGERLGISPKTAFGHMVTALERLKAGMAGNPGS